MTKIEKETVIRALEVYKKQQSNKATYARKSCQYEEAQNAEREKNIASGLIHIFNDLINIPTGKAKI